MTERPHGNLLLIDAGCDFATAADEATRGENWSTELVSDVEAGLHRLEAREFDCVVMGATKMGEHFARDVEQVRRRAPSAVILALAPAALASEAHSFIDGQIDGCIAREHLAPSTLQSILRLCLVRGRMRSAAGADQHDGQTNPPTEPPAPPMRAVLHDLRAAIGVIWLHLELLKRNEHCQRPEILGTIATIREATHQMMRTMDAMSIERRAPAENRPPTP
jgi:hypothetical protein